MSKENFTLGEVLSLTTGLLLCPIDGLYRICNHMTGADIYTHQFIKAMPLYGPEVKRQLPQIAGIDFAEGEVTPENWTAKLAALVETHGDSFELEAKPELWLGASKGVFGDLRELTDAPVIAIETK
jgi:hypothetical protein